MSQTTPDFFKMSYPLCLAPMVGLTHFAFREIIRGYLPDGVQTLLPTEMLNSRRLPTENLGQTSETYVLKSEVNIVPQILGNDEKCINQSVHRLNEFWQLAGIDINMGCPVQKALRHNYGVSLMGDSDYAAEVVKFTSLAVKSLPQRLPVSVKLRSVDEDPHVDKLCQFMDKLIHAGADYLTLHPRTPEQKRRGQADWSQLKDIKKKLSVPLIGNGDIQIADDVFRMLDETGVDKVMVGRAATGRPWIFWQVAYKMNLTDKRPPQTGFEEGQEYGRMLLKFIDICEKKFVLEIGQSPHLVLRKIQFFVRTSHVWLEFGHELMSQVNRSKDFSELKDRVAAFFEKEQHMTPYTDLRQ